MLPHRFIAMALCALWLTGPLCHAQPFGEAPMLKERVEAGKLPPVHERLPDDPPVIDREDEIEGADTRPSAERYGGTLRVLSSQGNQVSEVTWMVWHPLLRFDADGRTPVPHVARDWKMSEDGTSITIFLHKGMRWSDGVPVTVEDVEFAYNDVLRNEELNPVMPSDYKVDGKPMRLERIDDYTFRLHFARSYGSFPFALTHSIGNRSLLMPKHYLKQFHPKYTDKAELKKRAKEMDFDHWFELFLDRNFTGNPPSQMTPPDYPTLKPWQVSTVPAEGHVILERNPYYWKVDREGNQLPYIDRIHSSYIAAPEANNLKLISGEVDLASLEGGFHNSPLYLTYAKENGYRVFFWNCNWGSRVGYYPNQTHRDPVLRRLFQNRDFRISLSLGLNREEMNKVIYFGQCEPRQVTVNRVCSFFEPEFTRAYAEYDPLRAMKILDRLEEEGLLGKMRGRWRQRPDGRILAIVVDVLDGGMQPQTAEMVKEYWGDLGILVALRVVSGNLFWVRFSANAKDILTTPDDVATDVMVLRDAAYGLQYWAPLWYQHLNTGGERGEEPPEHIEELYRTWENMRSTTDQAERVRLGKKLIRSQAENLWGIGTVGGQLWPIIVSNRLHNVPAESLFGYPWLSTSHSRPERFYLWPQKR